MFICDSHCDTLYKMATMPGSALDITPARLKAGGVGLQTLAMFVGLEGGVDAAEHVTASMMSVIDRLKEDEGWHHVTDPAAAKEGDVSYLLSLEGGEVLTAGLDKVDEYKAYGVRMVSLTWNHENALATPHNINSYDGLKQYGLDLVKRLQTRHMAVDISHLNDAGVDDILTKTDLPPLASHSACRALMDHSRNLTDGQLKRLFSAGGYIGVVFCPAFLTDGQATIDSVIDHIDHLMELGGEGMVGFGSDFDGITSYVEGLSSPLDYPALLRRLKTRGYTDDKIELMAGQAFLDYFARINRA